MKLSPKKEYMLKSLPKDRKAHGGFVWPKKQGSVVTAPDWNPIPKCGQGLHGLYKGGGEASFLCHDVDAVWYVLEVDSDGVVDLGGKVKVQSCKVTYCGNRETAASLLKERYPENPIPCCAATAGNYGIATAGHRGTATAGNYGIATARNYGTATAGNCGTAIAGHYGTAIAGHDGTAIAGHDGTATTGNRGAIQIKYWDREASRFKIKTGYIGENDLLPNVPYKLNNQNEFVRADK